MTEDTFKEGSQVTSFKENIGVCGPGKNYSKEKKIS